MEDKWRSEMETAVADLQDQMRTNTTLTGIVDKRTETIVERQDHTDRKIDDIKEKVTPVVDVLDTIMPGVKVIGGLGKLGIWVWQRWVYVLAAIVFYKIIFSGGGFDAARDAFWLKLMEDPPK